MNIKELKKITNTDKFTELPLSTQALYFHLAINAERDSYISNPKAITRACCAGDNDLTTLERLNYIVLDDDDKFYLSRM
ncbi:hypothetical protein [Enterococcus cecorum]|uniref:hypothetical protein n=1 Tax=Enterococcus cecorum TaxID=44008 RepID=UPI000642CB89|nr:hypothetical protein [Enterococcus cecorum]KLO74479.1 hypothetical protein AA989_02505 [Enterococcus cecorum]